VPIRTDGSAAVALRVKVCACVQDPGAIAFASSRKPAIRFCNVRRLISSGSAVAFALP